MTNTDQFIRNLIAGSKALKGITKSIAIHANDLFDQNFTNQSFFGEKWTPSKYVERENKQHYKGQSRNLLQNSGHLRKSINRTVSDNFITFFSNVVYAQIHNEGGTINHPGGTAYVYDKKKKRSIWVSNRKASPKMKRTKAHPINIPQRQFIGNHKKLEKDIETIIENRIHKAFK